MLASGVQGGEGAPHGAYRLPAVTRRVEEGSAEEGGVGGRQKHEYGSNGVRGESSGKGGELITVESQQILEDREIARAVK